MKLKKVSFKKGDKVPVREEKLAVGPEVAKAAPSTSKKAKAEQAKQDIAPCKEEKDGRYY